MEAALARFREEADPKMGILARTSQDSFSAGKAVRLVAEHQEGGLAQVQAVDPGAAMGAGAHKTHARKAAAQRLQLRGRLDAAHGQG